MADSKHSTTPTLHDEASQIFPDWFKAAMLLSMSYREADSTNGLLVYVLTVSQWAAHPTNGINQAPPLGPGDQNLGV